MKKDDVAILDEVCLWTQYFLRSATIRPWGFISQDIFDFLKETFPEYLVTISPISDAYPSSIHMGGIPFYVAPQFPERSVWIQPFKGPLSLDVFREFSFPWPAELKSNFQIEYPAWHLHHPSYRKMTEQNRVI